VKVASEERPDEAAAGSVDLQRDVQPLFVLQADRCRFSAMMR